MGVLQEFMSNVRRGARIKAPELLTGIGIFGFGLTVVSACKATLKAKEVLEELEKQKEGEVTFWDKAKAVAPIYIPTGIAAAASVGCFIKSNRVSAERIATYASAYSLSEQTLRAYEEKTRERLGEKKEKEIRDEIAKEKLDKDPVTNSQVIVTGSGKSLCYDAMSGRYFETNIELIRQAVNKLNYRMISEMYVSLNDLYYELELPKINNGDNLGWNVGNGLIEPTYSTQITDDGRACLVLDYLVQPRDDYTNLH